MPNPETYGGLEQIVIEAEIQTVSDALSGK
jgi:hypothetical protein